MKKEMMYILVLTILVVTSSYSQWVGDFCVREEDCRNELRHATCDLQKKACVCKDGYHNIRNFLCTHVLHDGDVECVKDCDCSHFVPNSRCVNEVCECSPGFVELGGRRCVPAGTNMTTTTMLSTTTTDGGD